jgi:hypothetical protein
MLLAAMRVGFEAALEQANEVLDVVCREAFLGHILKRLVKHLLVEDELAAELAELNRAIR